MLARQALLNCAAFDGFGNGCDGGDVIDVFHYMSKHGLPDESCQIYSASDHTKFKGAAGQGATPARRSRLVAAARSSCVDQKAGTEAPKCEGCWRARRN